MFGLLTRTAFLFCTVHVAEYSNVVETSETSDSEEVGLQSSRAIGRGEANSARSLLSRVACQWSRNCICPVLLTTL